MVLMYKRKQASRGCQRRLIVHPPACVCKQWRESLLPLDVLVFEWMTQVAITASTISRLNRALAQSFRSKFIHKKQQSHHPDLTEEYPLLPDALHDHQAQEYYSLQGTCCASPSRPCGTDTFSTRLPRPQPMSKDNTPGSPAL
jgi:hypothetical protein